MKKALALVLALMLTLSMASLVYAEDYPGGKTITMICPWSAGGGSDQCVRLLVPYLEQELGTTITVINPTGGTGWVAWEQLLHAEADGLTIAQVNWPTLFPGYLNPAMGRDYTLDSFHVLANEVTDACVIAINKDETRFTNAAEFFAYAKENEVTFGVTGMGSDDHIMMEKVNAALGTQLTFVAAAGWADNSAAIQGGHIDATAANVGEVMNLAKDGELNVLCVFSTEESALLPGVPTFDSLGLCEESIVCSSQRGFAVKAGTPEPILEKLEAAFDKAINNEEFIAKMTELGMEVDYIAADAYYEHLRNEEEVMKGMADIMGW